jgi:hypothetical protein
MAVLEGGPARIDFRPLPNRREGRRCRRPGDDERARAASKSLAAIAYAQLDGKDLSASAPVTLEHHFKEASFHRHLTADQLRSAWSWRGLDCQIVAPVWPLAQATADFLLSDRSSQLRWCASDTCRWLFLDSSKSKTRRWCGMDVCGNRMKARRFHARKGE